MTYDLHLHDQMSGWLRHCAIQILGYPVFISYFFNVKIMVSYFQVHPWLTKGGSELLPSTYDNCTVLEPTEEEISNSIRSVPKIKTLVRQINLYHPPITSVIEMKDSCTVTTPSLSQVTDTPTTSCVTIHPIAELTNVLTMLFFSTSHLDPGETHVETWAFCKHGETQPNAVQHRFYAIEFITKISIFKGLSCPIYS
jgi:hypothetical protein